MKRLALIVALLSLGSAASAAPDQAQSLVDAELAFARLAAAKGTRAAFLANLAEDGVLFRPRAVNGKKHLAKRPADAAQLSWYPSVAEVSAAGDLGYTSGPYEYRASPEAKPSYGDYVSVWRRRGQGPWQLLVDLGTTSPRPIRKEPPWKAPASESAAGATLPRAELDAETARLLEVDRGFAQLAADKGPRAVYHAMLTERARFLRTDDLPLDERAHVYAALAAHPGTLTWTPEKAAVAASGELAYSYGVTAFQPDGGSPLQQRMYLRIWRRESKGAWRAVLDVETLIPPGK